MVYSHIKKNSIVDDRQFGYVTKFHPQKKEKKKKKNPAQSDEIKLKKRKKGKKWCIAIFS
jgi:hypothetical protein